MNLTLSIWEARCFRFKTIGRSRNRLALFATGRSCQQCWVCDFHFFYFLSLLTYADTLYIARYHRHIYWSWFLHNYHTKLSLRPGHCYWCSLSTWWCLLVLPLHCVSPAGASPPLCRFDFRFKRVYFSTERDSHDDEVHSCTSWYIPFINHNVATRIRGFFGC